MELFNIEDELRAIWEAYLRYGRPSEAVNLSLNTKLMVPLEWLKKNGEKEEEEMDSDVGE